MHNYNIYLVLSQFRSQPFDNIDYRQRFLTNPICHSIYLRSYPLSSCCINLFLFYENIRTVSAVLKSYRGSSWWVSGYVKLICRSLIFVIWLKHLIRSVGFKYKLVHFLSSDHRSFCLQLHFWSLQLCTPKVFINDVYNCKQGCYGLQTAEKNGWILDEIKYPM